MSDKKDDKEKIKQKISSDLVFLKPPRHKKSNFLIICDFFEDIDHLQKEGYPLKTISQPFQKHLKIKESTFRFYFYKCRNQKNHEEVEKQCSHEK